VGGAPTYRAEPFRVAVLVLNGITGLTVSHAALLQTEFSIIFLRFGGGGGGGGDGGEGDFNISPNRTIPAICPNLKLTLTNKIPKIFKINFC